MSESAKAPGKDTEVVPAKPAAPAAEPAKTRTAKPGTELVTVPKTPLERTVSQAHTYTVGGVQMLEAATPAWVRVGSAEVFVPIGMVVPSTSALVAAAPQIFTKNHDVVTWP